MRKFLSLLISFIMLFNLTAEVFAAPIQLASKEQQSGVTNALVDAYQNSVQNSSNTQNKDVCLAVDKDKSIYENSYKQSLKNFTDIALEYNKLEDLVKKIVKNRDNEEYLINRFNTVAEQHKNEIEKYEKNISDHKQKIEELGGIDSIKEEFNLYQNWLALKEEMEENKKQQEEIISLANEDLSHLPKNPFKKEKKRKKQTLNTNIDEAKQKLQDYHENYFSYQDRFETFAKEFENLDRLETEMQNQEDWYITPLNDILAEIDNSKIEKEAYLKDLDLPEQEGINVESDWNDIFSKIEEKVKSTENNIKSKKQVLETAEKSLYQKEACDFQKKMIPAIEKARKNYCNDVKIRIATTPIKLKWANLWGAWLSAGTDREEIKTDQVKWSRQKDLYRACINPTWKERHINYYLPNVTISELADYKFGEFINKYPLSDTKHSSIKKQIQIGEKLARQVRDFVLLHYNEPEKIEDNLVEAISAHFGIIGDYLQAEFLAQQLEAEWRNLGGTVTKTTAYEDRISIANIQLEVPSNATNYKELTAKKNYYSRRHSRFLEVQTIGQIYSRNILDLMTGLVDTIAHNGNTQGIGFLSSMDELGVTQETINDAYSNLNKPITQHDIDNYANSIQKPKFNPLLFFIAPYSSVVGNNRSVVRAKRNAQTGYPLDTSQTLKNILMFHTILLDTSSNKDEANLVAWNKLAYKAFDKKAAQLLRNMSAIADFLPENYRDKPFTYVKQIENSLHNPKEEFLLDLLVVFVASWAMKMVGNMVQSSIKTTIRSSIKKDIQMTMKRDLFFAENAGKSLPQNALEIVQKTRGNNFKPINTNLYKPHASADITKINNFKFKRPIGQTSSTLGRELGTKNAYTTKSIQEIKRYFGMEPHAANTRVFNTNISKREYAQLAEDLNNFYKQKTIPEKVTTPAKKASQKQIIEDYWITDETPNPGRNGNRLDNVVEETTGKPSGTLSNIFNKTRELFKKIKGKGQTSSNGSRNTTQPKEQNALQNKNATGNYTERIPQGVRDISEELETWKKYRQLSTQKENLGKEIENIQAKIKDINKGRPETLDGINTKNSITVEELSIKEKAKLVAEAPSTKVTLSLDYDKTFQWAQKEGLIFKSEEAIDEFIFKKSNESFKNLEAFNQAYKNAASPLHNEAVAFYDKTTAFHVTQMEVVIGKIGNTDIVQPLHKFIANMYDGTFNYGIKPTKNGKSFYVETYHSHGMRVDNLHTAIAEHKYLALVQKDEREFVFIFNKTRNGKYPISIFKRSEDRRVWQNITNYEVEPRLNGLGEQFIEYKNIRTGYYRQVVGPNNAKILYFNKTLNYPGNPRRVFCEDLENSLTIPRNGELYNVRTHPFKPGEEPTYHVFDPEGN